MKLYFIKLNQEPYGEVSLPLGLACLSAYIREKIDYLDIKILDQLPNEKIIKKIEKEQPEFIGFTAMATNYYLCKDVVKEIRKVSPDSILIIGGCYITSHPKSFFKSDFDIGVVGEGEITLEELIKVYQSSVETEFYNNLKEVKGLLLKPNIYTGDREFIPDLSILPVPAYDLLDMKYYTLPRIYEGVKRQGDIMTSRGCPYNCTYCGSATIWKRRVRFMSAEKVVDIIRELYSDYDVDRIVVQDDVFSLNKKRLKKIIRLLEKERILDNLEFVVSVRTDCFTEEIAKLFKKINVKIIYFGFETGSDKILSEIKDHTTTVADNKRAIELCKKYEFTFIGYFMVGSPNETKEDMLMTYEFIKENVTMYSNFNTLFKTAPLPATKMWDYALEKGLINEDYYEEYHPRYNFDNYDLILSQDISKEDFKDVYYKIKDLQVKPKLDLDMFMFLRLVGLMFNPYFYYIKYQHYKNRKNIK